MASPGPPSSVALRERVARCAALRLDRLAYRAFRYEAFRRYGRDAHPLNGGHRGRVGGRYNPPGSPATVYTSTSEHGATLEITQDCLIFGLDPDPGGLDVLVITVRDVPVLDLTSAAVLDALGVAAEAIVQACPVGWGGSGGTAEAPLTQRIGAAARGAGFCGVLAPSYLATIVRSTYPLDNVVLFLDSAPPWQPAEGTVTLDDPRGLYDA